MLLKISIFIMCSVFSFSVSLNEIKSIFGDKHCILGTLLELKNVKVKNDQKITKETSAIDIMNSSNQDKSPQSLINELADYNDINYSYELIDEQGPAHSKTFTIALYLGDEYYEAEEKSHKKCQKAAAEKALKYTKYNHPPLKLKRTEKSLTPTVLLNNLASKLGLAVTYTIVDDILDSLSTSIDYQNVDYGLRKSYVQKLNETLHSNDSIRIRKDISDPQQGPFKVRVEINNEKFIGEAHTIQNAKHEAALKALTSLKEQKDSFNCINEDGCKKQKQETKSPISLVYEQAQLRNLEVSFQIMNEIGPSHKKEFTTLCKIGNSLESTGTGSSKKKSKKAAAENVLPQLLELPLTKSPRQLEERQSNNKKKKKAKFIKSTFDKVDVMLDNVVEYGKDLLDKVRGSEMQNNNKNKPKGQQSHKTSARSAGEGIIKLGNILHLEVQFNDYLLHDKYFAVLDLGTKPAFICLGEGINQRNARDLAATYGMNVLNKLGLLDNLDSKSVALMSEVLNEEETYPELFVPLDVEEKKHRDEL